MIIWIGYVAGCGKPEQTEAEKALAEMTGPSSPIAQKLQKLNTSNAYNVGFQDGLKDFNISVPVAAQSGGKSEIREYLKNIQNVKNAFFDAVASPESDNQVNSQVLASYSEGWNAAWNRDSIGFQ